MPMLRQEHLDYFKSLFEGRAAISWNAWFRQHESALSEELPRMQFLQLKFHKLDEAEKQLRAAGVEFAVTPAAKRERYYAALHHSVLDDKGRPNQEFVRKQYDGAIGLFLDGNVELARDKISAYLKRIRRYPLVKRAEALADVGFDAEMEFQLGDKD